MKKAYSLIKEQSLRFDIHDSGSGQYAHIGRGLHCHKTMHSRKYKNVQVLIPLDNNQRLIFRFSKGQKDEKVENKIIREIKSVLEDDAITRQLFVNDIINQIERFSSNVSIQEKINYLELGAAKIADLFNLNDSTKKAIIDYIEDHKNIRQYTSYHIDEQGNPISIIQDVQGKNIRIGRENIINKMESAPPTELAGYKHR